MPWLSERLVTLKNRRANLTLSMTATAVLRSEAFETHVGKLVQLRGHASQQGLYWQEVERTETGTLGLLNAQWLDVFLDRVSAGIIERGSDENITAWSAEWDHSERRYRLPGGSRSVQSTPRRNPMYTSGWFYVRSLTDGQPLPEALPVWSPATSPTAEGPEELSTRTRGPDPGTCELAGYALAERLQHSIVQDADELVAERLSVTPSTVRKAISRTRSMAKLKSHQPTADQGEAR